MRSSEPGSTKPPVYFPHAPPVRSMFPDARQKSGNLALARQAALGEMPPESREQRSPLAAEPLASVQPEEQHSPPEQRSQSV